MPYEMWSDSLKAADYFMESPVLGRFPPLLLTFDFQGSSAARVAISTLALQLPCRL